MSDPDTNSLTTSPRRAVLVRPLRVRDRAYRVLYSRVIYPAYHGLLRDGAGAPRRELARSDRLDPSAYRHFCAAKLDELMRRVARDVPYYRKCLQDSGIEAGRASGAELLAALPPLTKDIIRAESDRLISGNLAGNSLEENSTSGSTGSPLRFFTDRRSQMYRAATVARNRRWLGILPGDPTASLWGSPIDSEKANAVRGRVHGLITRDMLLSAYAMRDSDMADYAARLASFRPRLLIGYPSVLVEFGRYCAERSIRFESISAILCSAEALYPDQRAIIEERLGVPVYNRYGSREVGDVAQEAPGVAGLLVNADRIHVEIVDEAGNPCAPGIVGQILVTDLDNFGMPLIRYAIGDLAAWGERTDEVPLPYPVLSRIEGRSLDVVRTPSGNRIGGTFWTILLREKPGIAKFQVVQEEEQGVRVRYVQDPDVSIVDLDFFTGRIREYAGEGFGVSFERVEEILPEPTGKYRVVVGLDRRAGNHAE